MTHWEQGYNALYVGGRMFHVCDACGCLVLDWGRHDQWHRVTRPVADTPPPKPPVASAEWAERLGFTVLKP